MASIEQKRADLEKALAALDESEIEQVAGGLSEKGKKVLKYVGIGAGVVAGVAGITIGGKFLYDKYGKKESSDGVPNTNPPENSVPKVNTPGTDPHKNESTTNNEKTTFGIPENYGDYM